MKFSQFVAPVIALFIVAALPLNGWGKVASYANHPQVLAFIDEVVQEHAFERDSLIKLFSKAKYEDAIVRLMNKPAEAKPWHEYRPIFVTDQRAEAGRRFMQTHCDALARAEAEFGVPAEIIVAIIGVETRYGSNTGSTRVIDALSTLAFDYPRRADFFRRELKAYLLLTRDEQLNPLSLKGSYAGAMGYGQFMPSSFRAYAIDFDGDGKKDIWGNPVDAIGSVANYFARHGWKSGEPVVSRARHRAPVNEDYWVKGRADLKPRYSLAELVSAGLEPETELPRAQPATAMKLEGAEGDEYWVGLHNFYVITRYNHSALYALSVYQLSQKIANQE